MNWKLMLPPLAVIWLYLWPVAAVHGQSNAVGKGSHLGLNTESIATEFVDLDRHGLTLDNLDGCSLHAEWEGQKLSLASKRFRIDVSPEALADLWGNISYSQFAVVRVKGHFLGISITQLSLPLAPTGTGKRYWLVASEDVRSLLNKLKVKIPVLHFFRGKAVGLDIPEGKTAYYGLPIKLKPTFSNDGELESEFVDAAWMAVTPIRDVRGTPDRNVIFISDCSKLFGRQ